MPGTLQGKTAIVTGASRGIGRAIALRLASEGAQLILSARDETKLNAVAAEIAGSGGKAAILPLDLRDPNSPLRLVDFTLSGSGRIDIVVNNAGATKRGDFTELTEEDWQDGFALKFFGAIRLARAAWSHLKAASGSLINIAGIGGRTPGAQFAIGGSVNAALLSFTKAIAELGIGDGVQVVAVNPGTIRTDRFQKRLSTLATGAADLAAAEERFTQAERITRVGEPEDIANLVAFIVGPQGRYLHGSLIDIDGGATKSI